MKKRHEYVRKEENRDEKLFFEDKQKEIIKNIFW